MADHNMSHRGITFEISAENGKQRTWSVIFDGQVKLFGHASRTVKSSAFRIAYAQARQAIDAMLDEEQAA